MPAHETFSRHRVGSAAVRPCWGAGAILMMADTIRLPIGTTRVRRSLLTHLQAATAASETLHSAALAPHRCPGETVESLHRVPRKA
jgi:hypothetical protein